MKIFSGWSSTKVKCPILVLDQFGATCSKVQCVTSPSTEHKENQEAVSISSKKHSGHWSGSQSQKHMYLGRKEMRDRGRE